MAGPTRRHSNLLLLLRNAVLHRTLNLQRLRANGFALAWDLQAKAELIVDIAA